MENNEQILNVLRQVYDPELGVNIVDLGLIYDVREEPEKIYVQMTLTTPGCPLHDTIIGGVRTILLDQTGKSEVEVDVVWEPQWTPERMSKAAKDYLAYF
ncbi:Fe-S protein maturation auxiliary factor SufT [Paenibacillus plantiphilus]|uniref:Fe-S protein maturation auxiliary factor SufT n=1 Tax=Paenibacillus plantiphilus TaxID=2905650 RepID=A0ABN8GGN2_9BACL|nr:metal-sulfur cluster assembly factor [Paenibacillus plantiphilus]CAH1208711.1 Fe-S protein maturation auxiliary factor SufT [Paenibacillus plantiphilus]